jgi:hypothetical protein
MQIRYREQKRLFRKSLLVLQVCDVRKRGPYISPDGDPFNTPPPSWDEEALICTWRDATVEDILSLKKVGLL